MVDVVKAVMKMIMHIEAAGADSVAAVDQQAQEFISNTGEQYGSIGSAEWAGTYLKLYLDLPFAVLEPAATTIVVESATKLIDDLKTTGSVAFGQVETEYASYDASAFTE